MYFGDRSGRDGADQVGYLDGTLARFGKSYIGEPDVIAEELSRDAAVGAADTLLLTVPNQLGVEYNARLLETVARQIAPRSAGSRRPTPLRRTGEAPARTPASPGRASSRPASRQDPAGPRPDRRPLRISVSPGAGGGR